MTARKRLSDVREESEEREGSTKDDGEWPPYPKTVRQKQKMCFNSGVSYLFLSVLRPNSCVKKVPI